MNQNNKLISASQLRAARSIMNWSRNECAAIAGLSPETIKNIECETYKALPTTNDSLVHVFAHCGIEFLSLRQIHLQTLSGRELAANVNIDGVLLMQPKTRATS